MASAHSGWSGSMAEAARNLISAINALAADIEREIFAARGVGPVRIGDAREDRERAMVRCQEAIAQLQLLRELTPTTTPLPRGEISAAVTRLEGILARQQRLGLAPRICGSN
ncbi:MAG TPA: hypothetical protein VMQ73_00100 [Methylomirabilota bacterium]|nr:hypothetical protein [Methylomirabilota bacterium]